MPTSTPSAMAVKVYAPFKIYFDAHAKSVSATNATGPFDILPGHHNFISLLKPCRLKVRGTNNEDFSLDITKGLIHVKTDKVTVFLDV